jgi:hypothetical protein
MKKLILNIAVLILQVEIIDSQWIQLPLTNISVYELVKRDNNIFAGTGFYGVYISSNDGLTWSQAGLDGNIITSLGVNSIAAFAGTWNNGVYASTNTGLNWFQTLSTYLRVFAITADSNYVYAASENGVYGSSNSGQNWIHTFYSNQTFYAITSNGANVFAGSDNGGVYISHDFGQSWSQSPLHSKDIRSLATKDSSVFAGSWGFGIFKSTNNGLTWVQTSLNNKTVVSLGIWNGIIFAGTGDANYGYGVYISTDNGISWVQKNEGMGNITILSLLTTPEYIIAGSYYSLWKRSYSNILEIEKNSSQIPQFYFLYQNYPNPFNPTTKIRFDIPTNEKSNVKLIIYDMLGSEIELLVDKHFNPGTYNIDWNASDYPSGVYFYKLEVENYSQTKKMVLIK